MKTIKLIILFYLILFSTNSHAIELDGVWATHCESNTKIDSENPWTLRVTHDGIYQIEKPTSVQSKLNNSKATTNLDVNDFTIIDNNTISYNNHIFKHCSKPKKQSNKTITEDQIKKYIQGEWRLSSQSINTSIDDLSNDHPQDPDINFLSIDQTTLNLKGDIKPIEYKVDADKLLLKLDKWRSVKVLLVDQNKLQLSFEMEPAKGVFIYYKTKKK